MKRLKGSELKMPELKVPDFLLDLYYDLRDRRLLPFLALVLVAIVAAPFLLAQESKKTVVPPAVTATAMLGEEAGGKSKLTVVEAQPGLREYKKRLRERRPTDPFRSLEDAGTRKGGGGQPAATSTSPTTSVSPTIGPSAGTTESSSPTSASQPLPAPSPPRSSSGGGGEHGSGGARSGGGANKAGDGGEPGDGGPENGQVALYTFAVDLRIVHTTGNKADASKQVSEPEVRREVLPATVLPGQKKQVVTYMGLSPKTRQPLFLISDQVTGVFGEGKCVAGVGECQLIELERGFPETFECGEGGDRYKVMVTGEKTVLKGTA